MNENVIIAGVFSLIKQSQANESDKKIKIRQSARGNNNAQIGIQNNMDYIRRMGNAAARGARR